MSRIKRFGKHVVSCYWEAGDALDKGMRALGGMLFVGWIVGLCVAPDAVFVGQLHNPEVLAFCERGFLVVLTAWGLIWLPFRRVETLQNNYEKDIVGQVTPLRNRVAELEGLARPRFEFQNCQAPFEYPRPSIAGGMTFGVVVRNLSTHQGADGCIGHLIRITEVSTGRFSEMVHRLPFTDARDRVPAEITMSAGVPYLLPVVVVHQGVSTVAVIPSVGMTLQRATFMDGGDIFSNRGDYDIIIGVSGFGVGIKHVTLRFTWTGNATTSALTIS
jgi:hypothetical protein